MPDGVGIVYANMLINGSLIRKISGMDVFLFLLRKLDAHPDLAMKQIENDFPSLIVRYYSPPFKLSFSSEELESMTTAINNFNAYLLFIGMTAPKQEKWAYVQQQFLRAKIICSVGAVFDFYSGTIKRPGRRWQALGLEWFGRFIREPRRLYKRYLISLPYFILQVFKEAFKKRFFTK